MSRYKHPIRIGLGILLLILAAIGVVVPVMQGWIFFVLALAFFFPSHPRVVRAIRRIEPKWPRFVLFLRRLGVGDPIKTEPPETPL